MSISQNNALFALLGVTFGGNGVSTFGLPDLQGRSPVGTAAGAGLSPIVPGQMSGTESAALTIGNLPSHTHTAQVTGGLSVSGTLSIPACSTPTSGTLTATPGPTTVLGPVSAAGRAGELYTTTAANTTLAPANVQLSGPSPAYHHRSHGQQPAGCPAQSLSRPDDDHRHAGPFPVSALSHPNSGGPCTENPPSFGRGAVKRQCHSDKGASLGRWSLSRLRRDVTDRCKREKLAR